MKVHSNRDINANYVTFSCVTNCFLLLHFAFRYLEKWREGGVGGEEELKEFLLGKCRWPLKILTLLESILRPTMHPITFGHT